MTMNVYGDITPRTAAFVVVEFLKRAQPYMVLEKFGQVATHPTNSTLSAKWRRYFIEGATGAAGSGTGDFYVPLATTPLIEGVTPSGRKLSKVDVTVTMAQYGDFMILTDVVEDTHEDPILRQMVEVLGEQAGMTLETVRWNVLKAGTNVKRVGPSGIVTDRNQVGGVINIGVQRTITTALTRQNAKKFTNIIASTPAFRTEPVEAAFFALCHPDLETDIRNMSGYIAPKQYGTGGALENEVGAVEQVRYLTSTIFGPWINAGAATSGDTTKRSTGGTYYDVYPILYLARDAYGIVPLKGKSAVTPMVVNPKPANGDPLGQRGSVGWKAYQAAVILQDAFMIRAEVVATA